MNTPTAVMSTVSTPASGPAPTTSPTTRLRINEAHLPFVDLLDRVAILAAADRARFQRVRAALRPLQEWFARHTGWTVQSTQEFVRLVKSPDRPQPGHGLAGERADRPYTAREYAMMVWVLWYAEKANADQFAVTVLAKEIQDRAAEVVAPHYIDWTQRGHRAALRAALHALEALGIVVLVDGDLRPYVDEGTGDALYEYTALATHLPVLLADDCWMSIVVGHDTRAIDVLPEHDRSVEFRAWRALLLTTGVTAHDPDLLAHVRAHRHRFADELRKHFGWALELGPAYAAIVRTVPDPRGRTTFPTLSSEMALPLLLANAVRDEVAAGTLTPDPATDAVPVSRERLEALLSGVRASFREHWSAELAALEVPALADRLLAILATWGLVAGPDALGQLHLLPMLGRYAGVYRSDGLGLGSDAGAGGGDGADDQDDEDNAV